MNAISGGWEAQAPSSPTCLASLDAACAEAVTAHWLMGCSSRDMLTLLDAYESLGELARGW